MMFRDAIQTWIDNGKLKFPKKTQVLIDINPFPDATVNMVDVHLSKKHLQKIIREFIKMHHVPKQNSLPRLKIDLSQNEPPEMYPNSTYLTDFTHELSSSDFEGPIVTIVDPKVQRC